MGSRNSRTTDVRSVLLVGVVVIALVALALCLGLLVRTDARSVERTVATKTGCTRDVTVAAAPRIRSVVMEGLGAQYADCVRFDVRDETDHDVVADAMRGEMPDVWIPDGDWSLGKAPVKVLAKSVASTPLVIAAAAGTPAPATWAAALGSPRLGVPDPLEDSVGGLAIMSPRLEAEATGGDPEAARAFLVPMAQRYGEYQAEDRVVDTDIAVRRRLGRAEIVTTEAEFLAAQAGRRGMRMVVPRTGTGLLSFPLAVREDAPAYARRAARDLRDWLLSQAGRRALAHAHLRGPGGRALQQGGIGDPGFLPAVVTSDLDAYRLTWQVMSVPSSVLAIFDVSGSMDFPTPHDGRRIDVAVGAAQVALDVFPDHARVGLWVFSINRGGKGQDWRVLDPVRRLDSNLGGITQRASLLRRAREMRTMAKGGTGLYDTALAGYRAALRAYDPNYSNVMILLTDGANDDPRSIGQKALLARLGKLRDPRRPVRIIGIAISKDADLTSLTRIARATGGNAYRADTPTDILKVFASEIANRS